MYNPVAYGRQHQPRFDGGFRPQQNLEQRFMRPVPKHKTHLVNG
jgi:hypothetical protein